MVQKEEMLTVRFADIKTSPLQRLANLDKLALYCNTHDPFIGFPFLSFNVKSQAHFRPALIANISLSS